MTLLACVGVDEEGFREVLAVEVTMGEKGTVFHSGIGWGARVGSSGAPLAMR